MRLLATRKRTDLLTPLTHKKITGHRWALHVNRWSISVESEDLWDEEWCPGTAYFDMSLTSYFSLGGSHGYYDGPHCSFSLGWLHLNWSYWWCKKCCEG